MEILILYLINGEFRDSLDSSEQHKSKYTQSQSKMWDKKRWEEREKKKNQQRDVVSRKAIQVQPKAFKRKIRVRWLVFGDDSLVLAEV